MGILTNTWWANLRIVKRQDLTKTMTDTVREEETQKEKVKILPESYFKEEETASESEEPPP